MGFFTTPKESWEAVLLTVAVYGFLFWVPPNLSYVLVGRNKIQRLQFRLAVIGTVILLITMSVYRFTENYFGVTIAVINWFLLILAFVKRDNLESQP